MRDLTIPESDPDEDIRECYGHVADWIMEEANAFGGDTALNL